MNDKKVIAWGVGVLLVSIAIAVIVGVSLLPTHGLDGRRDFTVEELLSEIEDRPDEVEKKLLGKMLRVSGVPFDHWPANGMMEVTFVGQGRKKSQLHLVAQFHRLTAPKTGKMVEIEGTFTSVKGRGSDNFGAVWFTDCRVVK